MKKRVCRMCQHDIFVVKDILFEYKEGKLKEDGTIINEVPLGKSQQKVYTCTCCNKFAHNIDVLTKVVDDEDTN